MAVGAAALAFNQACANGKTKSHITETEKMDLKGNINHSACRWCYNKIPLDELCEAAKNMGLKAIDLLNPPEYEVAIKTRIRSFHVIWKPPRNYQGF